MSRPIQYQHSREYDQFRCIGAACEDTCCDGWQVSVDRKTYDRYQECTDPVLGPQLRKWVQITPAGEAKQQNFANIVLHGSTCPFLTDKLCSIHRDLGEDYLGTTCATFPRISNSIDGVVERSLDLSCPEAARLVLCDPTPATFDQVTSKGENPQEAICESDALRPFFWEIRSALLSILQDRRFPVVKRLVLAGHVCDRLTQAYATGKEHTIPELLEAFLLGIDGGLYTAHLAGCTADASVQINTVLELMAERIKLDFVSRRFTDLYLEVLDGLQLKPGMSMNEAGERYARAYQDQYRSFMARHEHMLEHYLVHYAYRSLFPFGSGPGNTILERAQRPNSFSVQYMLMASCFAVVQSSLVGLAANHGSQFGPNEVIRCIQLCSRTLEHCTSFPERLLQILGAKGIHSAAGMMMLTQNPTYRQGTLAQTSFVIAAGAGR